MDSGSDRSHAPPPSPNASEAAGFEAWISEVAATVTSLTGWRRWLTCLSAGALSMLAMPPFFASPLLLLTLPILVWSMSPPDVDTPDVDAGADTRARPDFDRRRLWHAASAGWLFGFAFHVAGLYWLREAFLITGGGLGELWPLGVLGLPAGLAIFHAVAAAAATAVSRPGLSRVLALAIALGITEWLRGNILTGFPWNILGIALTNPLLLMQSSGLVGIYGLTSVAVLALGGPLCVLAEAPCQACQAPPLSRNRRQSRRFLAASLLLTPLAIMLGYGAWRLSMPRPQMVDGVRLRLVQPAIPQRDKWRPDKQPEILARHLELSRHNALGVRDDLAGITHVVWPEAALPFLPLQRPNVMAAIADVLPDGVHLLTGIVRIEPRPSAAARAAYDAYNSLAVIDSRGSPVSVYDKTHLVPFGEYLPLQNLMERIGLENLTRQRGGFASGRTPRPLLDVGPLSGIGPLICYEGIFPGTARLSARRPSVFVNITNDGWFGNSTGPRQHMHQARLRAIEDAIPLVRVANNGISALFDPYGRELARLDLDIAGVIDVGVPHAAATPPPYGRYGDLIFILILCAIGLAFLNTKSE